MPCEYDAMLIPDDAVRAWDPRNNIVRFNDRGKGKEKPVHTTGVYPGFCSMERV